MGHPSRGRGFVLLAGHLAIFTTYLPQVATFFPVALAGIETVTVTEFFTRANGTNYQVSTE